MLITKEVSVSWHKLNKDYYESKGYVFTKQRDRFLCKIEDLSIQSKENVDVQCDYCGKIYSLEFKGYVRNHSDYLTHIYECRDCEIKRVWFNVVEKCKELNFHLLSDISNYKTHKTSLDFICNIHPESGIQNVTVNTLLVKNCGCKLCSNKKKSDSSQKVSIEDAKHLFKDKGYMLLSTICNSAKDKLEYICPIHSNIIQNISYDKIKQGHGCKYCGNEKIGNYLRHDIDYVNQCFQDKGLILLETEYKNSSIPLRYLCKKHIDKGEQTITFNSLSVSDFGCKYCAGEYRVQFHSKGGITPLHNYLRGKLNTWNKDSMKACGYKCIITGDRFDTVHHLYGFNLILNETLSILQLPIYNKVNDYSKDELNQIENKCIELHYKYGLGVCLNKSVHQLFHKLYGTGNNTKQQFDEFKKRYELGEFEETLKEVS